MTPELKDRIVNRLIETGAADKAWALAVLAALEGGLELEGYLEGQRQIAHPPARAVVPDGPRPEPPGVYVSSITVEGFRGVGRPATLTLTPGPGLTLVVGRNGSGKSSFAEGLEFLLTGQNYRWLNRPKVWIDGWRNLHHKDGASLRAELLVEGQGTLSVSRAFAADDVRSGETTVKPRNGPKQTLDSMGWNDALTTFRPFLSYNELGSLLDEGPSKLYDALSIVLGLEDLNTVLAILGGARKLREDRIKTAKAEADRIVQAIARLEHAASDRRLIGARRALESAAWDIAALEGLVHGHADGDTTDNDLLGRLAAIALPDETGAGNAIGRLRSTDRALADLAGTNAERARALARLLEQAIAVHESHKTKDCPVCGAANVLSRSWAAATRKQITRLQQEAAAWDAAASAVKTAIREAQRFLTAPPAVLAEAKDLGLASLPEARRRWIAWAAGRDIDSAAALADHLETHILEFAEAVRQLVDEARIEKQRREDMWRPIAAAIAAWLPDARAAAGAKERVKELKAAETWWKETSALVRDERFAPIAGRAVAVWNQLRLSSNVALGGIALEGTAQRRRVTLQVTVDDSPAEALGVMSQGELHALALSLFLPRATLPESPFRFLSIDDPVQSMDPSRVEGLARALADAAKTRQVIVFTHDDRLHEAVRRLGLSATVLGVTRRARSVVEVRPIADPVSNLLEDARAVALTPDLPAGVAGRVVPGFCRTALEAACMEQVRRRRLARGETHDVVEELLAANARTHPLMALAFADDPRRTEDVLPKLRKIGPWALDAFTACKSGAHQAYTGDPMELIESSRKLAARIADVS